MRNFRFMVEARDATGAFFVTCNVVAESLEAGRAKLKEYSSQARWQITNWEDQEDLGVDDIFTEPGVVSETARSYFDVRKGIEPL